MSDKQRLASKLMQLKAEKKKLKAEISTKKLLCNGVFGKLGSVYSAFYSPDLMLAVTLTGQLNLLCLVHDIEAKTGGVVLSANTDGIMVMQAKHRRQAVLDAIAANAARTGFEYEETPYKAAAIKDINNYIAIKTNGKVKRKGLYAETGLMKNPTMEVCTKMAIDYLKSGVPPQAAIRKYTDPKDYVAIRAVKGGGIQYERMELVDDWIEVAPGEWKRRAKIDDGKATVKRKSKPPAAEVGAGGKPFGRIARWYMTTESLPPICYIGSGNRVPKTEGARVCMTLPETLPPDLDKDWYINETMSILADLGVDVGIESVDSGDCRRAA